MAREPYAERSFGWEQQREIITALRAGGSLVHVIDKLYELTVPPTGVGVRRKPETKITVTRATVRALVAKGLLQQDQNKFSLTGRGEAVSVSGRRGNL